MQLRAAAECGILTSKEVGAIFALKLDAVMLESEECCIRIPKNVRNALQRYRLFVAKPVSHRYH